MLLVVLQKFAVVERTDNRAKIKKNINRVRLASIRFFMYHRGMKKLKKQFIKKKIKYTQVKREGNVAIYSQELDNVDVPKKRYEVVIIKSHNGYELGGAKIAAAEIYPGSSQWGVFGWTYLTLPEAEKRYKAVLKKEGKK